VTPAAIHLSDKEVRYGRSVESTTSAVMSPWLALLLAGAMEIVWALGLKYSDGFSRLWPTVGTILAVPLSFIFLAVSLKSVPFGTAYAIWAGIGAAGVVVVGMLLFGERVDVFRVACLGLIIIGMVGLKLATPD
jgi:quaternary ammonium compound-resistance protein SugE